MFVSPPAVFQTRAPGDDLVEHCMDNSRAGKSLEDAESFQSRNMESKTWLRTVRLHLRSTRRRCSTARAAPDAAVANKPAPCCSDSAKKIDRFLSAPEMP